MSSEQQHDVIHEITLLDILLLLMHSEWRHMVHTTVSQGSYGHEQPGKVMEFEYGYFQA